MNSKKVLATQLAKFLRISGDEVINGNCKLSLTTYALSSLNALFNEILLSERYEGEVFHYSKQTVALFDDVQYLLAFVSKTPSLKLLHSGQTLRGGIDLSKFTNLKILELHKVPVHLVVGLEKLSSQLETLICNRSLCFLKEIFSNYGLDLSCKDVWIALTELNVSFNHIDGFDESFGILPNITYIDASHNNIEHADEIQMLEKLVFLNLSYNLLANIPILSGLSCYSLKVLFMRNNVLEDLEGVDSLINLEELDVSYNCLSEHRALKFLKKLTSLKNLHLEGNPIFFHKNHRWLTVRYLHPVVLSHLLLNGTVVSSDDVMSPSPNVEDIYNTPIVNFHQTSINVIEEKNMQYCHKSKNTNFVHDDNAEIASMSNESPQRNIRTHGNLEGPLNSPTVDRVHNKKIREVTIMDMENADKNEILDGFVIEEKTIPLHIQTKQLMEKRRKDFKEGWLIPTPAFETIDTSSSKVPTVSTNLSEPSQQPPEYRFSENCSDENIQAKQKSQNVCEENKHTNYNVQLLSTTSTSSEENDDFIILQKQVDTTLPQQEFSELHQEAQCAMVQEKRILLQQQDCDIKLEKQTEELEEPSVAYCCSDNLYQPYTCNESDDSDSHSDMHNDSDAKLFIVRKIDSNQGKDLFIKIKGYFIEEMDAISGKIKETLDLRSLLAIEVDEKGEDYVLNLNFDSANTSRQNRQYEFQDKDICNEILLISKPFADAKTIHDLTVGAFQCLKCSSVFSKQAAHRKVVKTRNPSTIAERELKKSEFDKEAKFCPNCGNDVIVEAELINPSPPPLPVSVNLKNNALKPHKNDLGDSCTKNWPPMKCEDNERKIQKVLPNSSAIVDEGTEQKQRECTLENIVAGVSFSANNTSQLPPKNFGSDIVSNKWDSSLTNEGDVCDHFSFISLLTKREKFSSDTFTMIDHRLKLHLENKLFDDDEYLESCLEEVSVVAFPTCEDFSGVFAVSNKNVHILKSFDSDKDKFEESIKPYYVIPLKRLKIVNVLLGNQGFSITCDPNNRMFLFLVRDADLCNSFILHLTEIQEKLHNFEPSFVSLTNESLIQIENEIIRSYYPDMSNNDPQHQILLHLFAHCKVSDQLKDIPVCIVITWKDVFLSTIQFKKQNKSDTMAELFQYVPFGKQHIMNLTEVHLGEDLRKAAIRFHDEDTNTSGMWMISTRTRSSLLSFLCEFKKPWEAVFGIELPLYFINEFKSVF